MVMVRIAITVLILAVTCVLSAAALENKGAERITMDGGSRGLVKFPHHRHQNVLGDCKICHNLFPQEKGGIARLKSSGELIKKQVMTKHCIKCHRARKKAGENTGPTTCARCHEKKSKQ